MPKWLDNAIFYEIYPQSFKDTNSDGIGDLNGIIEKLDYIKDLGCNAIWLNPCFDSPFVDAGYDITDYYKVAPRYGTNDDLKCLFDEIHKRNMHIFLDLVPGHTSDKCKWFLESMKVEKNEYSDRYIWTDNVWENPDGLNCIRGISDRFGSCAVNFFSAQPALNYGYAKPIKSWQKSPESPEATATRNAIKDVMRFWLDMGCDGFRIDMAFSLIKEDEGYLETQKLWADFRRFLDKEYPDAAIISEWGEPKYSLAGGFHMDFTLPFGPGGWESLFRADKPFFSSKAVGDISVFAETYPDIYEFSKGKGIICIPTGNHDTDRLARKLSQDEMKLAFTFILSMPGAPFIYYGDEIGMRYVENLTSVEGGFQRTGSRTPMQWNSEINNGFSNASKEKLYIRQDSDPDRPTVQKQENDKESLLNTVKKLIAIRQANSALQSNGDFELIFAKKNDFPLVYKRTQGKQSMLIAINPSLSEKTCEVGNILTEKVIFSIGSEANLKAKMLTVPPFSATIFELK